MTEAARKPRIALMGEFSAGKSTLSNLLLGARPLPEKVTATRLSPVWMSYGTDAPYRVDVSGAEEPVSLDTLEGIDVDATRVIRLFFEADILQVCDLIDFPGISDPNMSSEVWQRMMGEVDAVLWCTHATQAWRQSEAAVWDTVPEAVRERSVLLVTKFDKLTSERDKFRVLARLGKETEGKFGATFPISLTAALAAGEDYEAFEESGGGAFLEHLIPLIDELKDTVSGMQKSVYATASTDVDPEPESAPDQETPAASEDVKREPLTAFTQAVAAQPDPEPAPQPETIPEVEPEKIMSSTPVEDTSLSTASDGPAVHVDSAQPVVHVDSDAPVAAPPVDALDARVLPKRVRPTGGATSARPRRPAAKGQVLSMSDTPPDAERETARASEPSQLRSIFFGSQDGAASQ
ncbi:MAG: dynamin family protein [Pseudomonadota bacterium]